MQIASAALVVPSLRITNSQLLDEFAARNADAPASEVRESQRLICGMFEECGAQTRYYRDRASGENALDLTLRAAREALAGAGVAPSGIDLVIYCGVSRGFLEPATAYLVARSLGMHCQCFDVLDACMGWVRALYVAHALFGAGAHSRVLVVNAECSVHEYGYPDLLKLRSPEDLAYTFPAYTIGEAATATVLVRSQNRWHFQFRSDPSKAHLCTLPIAGYADYSNGDNLAMNGAFRFMSHGRELTAYALREIVRFVRTSLEDWEGVDLWLPHAASATLCKLADAKLQLGGRVYSAVFPRLGNVVSASIPAALCMAAQADRLRRGNRIVLCPASAGMVVALADTVY